MENLEKKFLGGDTTINMPVVKTENTSELNDGSLNVEEDNKMNPTGTAKRDRKRIHKCDREGCTYATDHIGHYR